VLLVAGVRPADACSCAQRLGGACLGAWDADAVFLGTVTEIADVEPGEEEASTWASRRVRLGQLETFLGESADAVMVRTGQNQAACGFPFVTGRRYLVYAYQDDDGVLHTSICSRTAEERDARADLEYLRAQTTAAVRTDGRLFGEVRRLERGLANRAERGVSVYGVRVRATSVAGTFETTSTADGTFSMDVPPGAYAISVEAPEGHEPLLWPSPAELVERRGCVGIGVTLRPVRLAPAHPTT